MEINRIVVRKVKNGDEYTLAYIQTESWKAAFRDIIPEDLLLNYKDLNHTIEIYQRLIKLNKGNGYILEIDDKPNCIAYWEQTRHKDMPNYAELICIHSLEEHCHQGYGSLMMERILKDMYNIGYSKVMLGVFEKNTRAISFYKKYGFHYNGKSKEGHGAVEIMLELEL